MMLLRFVPHAFATNNDGDITLRPHTAERDGTVEVIASVDYIEYGGFNGFVCSRIRSGNKDYYLPGTPETLMNKYIFTATPAPRNFKSEVRV